MSKSAFISDKRGATAVEFALLITPFISLLFVTLQTILIFLSNAQLDTATRASSRLLMTGSAQQSSMSQGQFKNQVCAAATNFDCAKIMVDVQSSQTFSSLNGAAPTITYGANGLASNSFSYSPGGPNDVVIVRVMYAWPVIGGILGVGLVNQPNNTRLLVSTFVFKNEPYA